MNNALIIDNQPLYSEALSSLIKTAFPYAHVMETTDPVDIMDLVRNKPIDLVILDVVVGDRDGLRLAESILASGYRGKLLFVSCRDYTSLSRAAFELGASGFLNKNESKETIMDALVSISRGYSIFKATQNLPSSDASLSSREAMVFQYLAQGYSNKKVAEQLSLSAKTVSTYKSRILKKYHANSLVELLNTVPTSSSEYFHY
ncbi:response regulator transcription factor [Vibrio sp. SCSIO 43153]|uniref:response regulator transcription factor n=1 Tax=Vibrio sp. SCSIO 43153 TaxID=2819098 RepID=UPI0020764CF4|nr:response regulator transcription factor [Vibrio sp. SCSIO 43153]USD52575.1 response regulator transcription factor [Vibrio sp. SCSIO 43153]